MSWVVKWTIFYVFCLVCTEQEFFTTCVALYFKQWQQSLKIRRRMKYLLNQVKYLFYMLVIVNLFQFFQLKKHAVKQFKQNLCLHINTFIGFPHFCVIKIIQFHFRWNIIRFYLRRKEIKKIWIQVESLTLFFGLPFLPAFTLRIFLPIIPFWSSWTLSQISNFSACRVRLLNGVLLIVLCLLMVVEMTE